jgi:hypothetical protein
MPADRRRKQRAQQAADDHLSRSDRRRGLPVDRPHRCDHVKITTIPALAIAASPMTITDEAMVGTIVSTLGLIDASSGDVLPGTFALTDDAGGKFALADDNLVTLSCRSRLSTTQSRSKLRRPTIRRSPPRPSFHYGPDPAVFI